MNRYEIAINCHKQGFNCCQSVLAAFSDALPLDEETLRKLGSGFGHGAGTGELCGALTGAVMTLDLLFPADFSDPVAAKKRAVARAQALQSRFAERFTALRCADLVGKKNDAGENTPAAERMALSGCGALIVTAVELTEEIMREEGI